MTQEEARKLLGLGADEDPATQMARFADARQKLVDLVRSAPNEAIGQPYRDGLEEFDKALKVLKREETHDEAVGLESVANGPKESSEAAADLEELPELELPPEAVSDERVQAEIEFPELSAEVAGRLNLPDEPPVEDDVLEIPDELPSRVRGVRLLLYGLLFTMIGVIGGGWLYFHVEESKRLQLEADLAFLENLGAKLVEGRSWDEADQAYVRIEELAPGSKVAELGRQSIVVGKVEEQREFVEAGSAEARAAFEAGRFDAAIAATDRVLERYPSVDSIREFKQEIEVARVEKLRKQWSELIRTAIASEDWVTADGSLQKMEEGLSGDPLISKLAAEVTAAKEALRRRQARAAELADAARMRDGGVFDAEALEWARQAVALSPGDKTIRALYEKLAAYVRTLRVPEDVATLKEALAIARAKDRVVLGEGVFPGGLVINVGLHLEGAGEGKTVVTAGGGTAPAVTLGPGAVGASVTGIDFGHVGFDTGVERYPVALVRGSVVDFKGCSFKDASGHGMAVQEGARVTATGCKFEGNGWDGAAAQGKGTSMTLNGCRTTGNFSHGIEAWDGALVVVQKCLSKGNSGNGILIDSAAEGLDLTENELIANREYGVVLAAGASGDVRKNLCLQNLLGGMLVRFSAISVVVDGNRLEKNQGPGLLLEQGLRADIYSNNPSRSNRGKSVISGARFE